MGGTAKENERKALEFAALPQTRVFLAGARDQSGLEPRLLA